MQKTYNPKEFEKRIYNDWLDLDLFKATANGKDASGKVKKPFVIVMPPPNITGQLHMGHALNNTIQDVLTRYKRAKGFEALWVPGTDHASIATEVKITEKLASDGIDKKELGRDGFLQKAFEWNDQYGGRIVEQLKELGCSCDWSRRAFTMDEGCSVAVLETFVSLYDKGLIYRGDRMVNWCPECRTALSDAEVEHKENVGKLWYIKYPMPSDSSKFIMVATTRPETLLGDSAVAVNPKDKRYKDLIGQYVELPLTGRKIKIIADDYVDAKFGTGAVKITPSHDPNDFEVGNRHSLERISVMDESGHMNENAGEYAGLDRFVARKKIVEDLEKLGLLEKTESRQNNVGTCYRCSTIIEPCISRQWFVKMETLAKPALEAVKKGDVKFKPKRFDKVYVHWLKNIKDWCISRQLWWGHRIPAYYCDDCLSTTVAKGAVDKCAKCGSGKLKQDEDVLDTWFSSALWPFSTLGWPNKTADLDYFYPTDVLVTGYDIIFFWVARMVFSGYEQMKQKPFNTVLINGLVRDSQGRKMAKSLGNGIDPLEIIANSGADALRFSLLNGIAMGADQRFSLDKVESSRNFMNKIYNASRFVIANCEGIDSFDIAKNVTKLKKLSLADRWILNELNSTVVAITKALDRYETGIATATLYDFTWNTFCDWYIECAKSGLNSHDASVKTTTQNVLLHVLKQILIMLHPFVPFITEEIYANLPNKAFDSIMQEPFSLKGKAYKKDAADFKNLQELVRSIRNFRQEKKVPPSKKLRFYLVATEGNQKLVANAGEYLKRLAGASEVAASKLDGESFEIVTLLASVFIPKNDVADSGEELARLKKELAHAQSELALANKKLSNPGFTAKAPKALLEQEQAKVVKYTELKSKLEASIATL